MSMPFSYLCLLFRPNSIWGFKGKAERAEEKKS
jgi:hypothetical protein